MIILAALIVATVLLLLLVIPAIALQIVLRLIGLPAGSPPPSALDGNRRAPAVDAPARSLELSTNDLALVARAD